MVIVRSDTVGKVDLRLVCRPTNTCIGVNNFHFYAAGNTGHFKHPVVRFFGTDSEIAVDWYELALGQARAIEGEFA